MLKTCYKTLDVISQVSSAKAFDLTQVGITLLKALTQLDFTYLARARFRNAVTELLTQEGRDLSLPTPLKSPFQSACRFLSTQLSGIACSSPRSNSLSLSLSVSKSFCK